MARHWRAPRAKRASRIKAVATHVWRYRPWNIVGWNYCEIDEREFRVKIKSGTTYLYKVLLMYSVILVANFLLMLMGIKVTRSEVNIYDA